MLPMWRRVKPVRQEMEGVAVMDFEEDIVASLPLGGPQGFVTAEPGSLSDPIALGDMVDIALGRGRYIGRGRECP